MVRTSFHNKGWAENMFHRPTSAMTNSRSKWHACWQQRSTLSTSPLSLEMCVLLGPGDCRFSKCPTPILVVAPGVCREGMGERPTEAWYTDGSNWSNPSTWTAVAIHRNTDTIWMKTGVNCSSQ